VQRSRTRRDRRQCADDLSQGDDEQCSILVRCTSRRGKRRRPWSIRPGCTRAWLRVHNGDHEQLPRPGRRDAPATCNSFRYSKR
jgi:hypothetical protein